MIPRLITTLDDVRRLADHLRTVPAYTYDFETLGLRVKRLKVAGIGFAWGPDPEHGAYILTAHEEHPHLDWEDVLPILKPVLEDERITQVAHNSLFDASILDRFGVKLHTNTYDTMVMAWLLNTETPNGLKGLVKRLYDYEMKELSQFVKEEVVAWHPGKILRLDRAPIEALNDYAVDDVLWTYRLWQDALEAIKGDEDLNRIYHELYQEYLLILAQMQVDGIALDVDFLREREVATRDELRSLMLDIIAERPGQDFEAELCANWTAADVDRERKNIPELQKKWSDRNNLRPLLYEHPTLAHKIFNPGSGLQLNQVLFAELGLSPLGEKGASGLYSVGAEYMAKYVNRDPSGFVRKLMRFTMLQKLQGTYHEGLQELVDDDNRIRTSFNPTLATGRLSSSSPNVQNIPARTDEGKEIRRAFTVRGPEWTLVAADFSQMEMRITAHFSGDEGMIAGFRAGADPHSITAKLVFDLPCEFTEVAEQFPKYRAIGKTLNFAVLYGAGAERVADTIALSTKGEVIPTIAEAQAYKDDMLRKMPGVADWIAYQERLAKREGKVFTLIGRPRHLSAAQNYSAETRGEFYGALRRGVNTPIQGTAADIIAIAKRNIRREFLERGWWRTDVFLVLQVHDELLFEVRREVAEEAAMRVQWHMEHAVELDVPVVAEPSIGDTWLDVKG